MWNFLDHMLERGGVVAVLFTGVIIVFSWVVRTLWNTNQAQHREYMKAIKEVQTAHIESMDEIQEKRVTECRELTERMLDILRDVDTSNGKIRIAIETLSSVLQDRRR